MTEGSQEGEWQHLAFVYDLDKTLGAGFSEGFSAAACWFPHGLFVCLFVCGVFFVENLKRNKTRFFLGCVVCFVIFGGVSAV